MVSPGIYRFTLDGPLVLRYAAGLYNISGPDDHHRRGTFCAYLNQHFTPQRNAAGNVRPRGEQSREKENAASMQKYLIHLAATTWSRG